MVVGGNLVDSPLKADSKSGKKDSKEINIVLFGKRLDVSQWAHRHPGGSKVLKIFNNRDATEQFIAFHSPSARKMAETMLKNAKPVEPNFPQPSQTELGKDFAELREKLIELGLFKPVWSAEIVKILFVLVPIIVGSIIVQPSFSQDSLLIRYLGVFLFAFGAQQAGWVGHDYSHHSVFRDPKMNDLFGAFFGWIQGYCLGWWKARHNTHHVVTNEVKNDPDIKTQPLFHFFPASTWENLFWIQKLQHLYFVPFYFLLDIYWKVESLQYCLNRLPKEALTLASIVFYWICIYAIWAPVGFVPVLTVFLLKGFMTSIVVFATHYSEERLQANPNLTFAEQSARTSRNIAGGYLADQFSGCISRQVTHHLFPMMPTSKLPEADKHVAAFLSKHNLPFNEDSLVECTLRNIRALTI